MTYKPFLTYKEQINKLTNEYGLTIDNYDFAVEALSSLSYYDLINGYKEVYMVGDKFIEGTPIEFLQNIHFFNKNIQSILLKYATYIENSFKTALSYEIANSIGDHQSEYLNIENYRKPKTKSKIADLKRTISNMNETINNNRFVDNPTRHYIKTKDHVPPWILFKNTSFFDSTNLYSFLPKESKENICNSMIQSNCLSFEAKNPVLLRSLILIRKFRNVIAHNLKFITYRMNSPNHKVPKEINLLFEGTLVYPNEMKTPRDDPWGMILCMITLINNKKLKKDFIRDLIYYFNKPMETSQGESVYLLNEYCMLTNFPEDILKRLVDYLELLKDNSDVE